MITAKETHNLVESSDFRIFKGFKEGTPLSLDINKHARFIRISLQEKASLNLDKVIILDSDGNSLTKNATVIVSSSYENLDRFNGDRLIDGAPNGGVNFHSKNEQSPWVIIDLKHIENISKIVIYNRGDNFYYRALSITVGISTTLAQWETIHDNLLYRKTNKYLSLSPYDKSLCDLAALQPGSAIKAREKMLTSGDKNTATAFQKIANEILYPHKLSLGPHGLTQTFSIKTDKQKEEIYHNLSEFLNILNHELGLSAFPSSGTLLGFVRTGKLLEHDDDIDVCYISNMSNEKDILDERAKIIKDLKDKGYQVTNSDVAHLWIKSPSGIAFDLFTAWIEGDRCIMNPLPNSGVKASNILPLEKIKTNGVDIYLPNNPIPLMELNYGPDWEKPDPMWRFDWSHARKQYNFLYFG